MWKRYKLKTIDMLIVCIVNFIAIVIDWSHSLNKYTIDNIMVGYLS